VSVVFDPGVNPANHDILPIVDVLNPPRGQTVSGLIEFEVDVYDPDTGTESGDGIVMVRLDVFDASDDLRPVVLSREFSSPSDIVRWSFDTRQWTPDGIWGLAIEVTSANFAVNEGQYHFLVDNTGPSF